MCWTQTAFRINTRPTKFYMILHWVTECDCDAHAWVLNYDVWITSQLPIPIDLTNWAMLVRSIGIGMCNSPMNTITPPTYVHLIWLIIPYLLCYWHCAVNFFLSMLSHRDMRVGCCVTVVSLAVLISQRSTQEAVRRVSVWESLSPAPAVPWQGLRCVTLDLLFYFVCSFGV